MASKSVKTLGLFKKPGVFDKGLAALLPEAYRKFYKEWKLTEPTAVHYIPEQGRWKRNEITGEVLPVQNIPIPLTYPKEYQDHIWGGEAIIQGFQKRSEMKRRVPHFWVPTLKRSVVYSEILDKYLAVTITDRAIKLINANYGFDHYLLKTPACDLKSLLPLAIKKKILEALEKGCPSYADRPEKQEEVLKKYGKYLSAYTPEEIKWYGLSLSAAIKILKTQMEIKEKEKIIPMKHVYRTKFLETLKNNSGGPNSELEEATATSWLQKINPFGKKHET